MDNLEDLTVGEVYLLSINRKLEMLSKHKLLEALKKNGWKYERTTKGGKAIFTKMSKI